MLLQVFPASACSLCRLRACIAAKQVARGRLPARDLPGHPFSTNRLQRASSNTASETSDSSGQFPIRSSRECKSGTSQEQPLSIEEIVVHARRRYGDALPEHVLNEQELTVYERLYGKPLRYDHVTSGEAGAKDDDGVAVAETELLRQGEDGSYEEVLWEEDADTASDVTNVPATDGLSGTELLSPRMRQVDAAVSDDLEEDHDDEAGQRTHPLTLANRFATRPSTLQLPKSSFVEPLTALLSNLPSTHLQDAAHRAFGGRGLPYSASTPMLAMTMQQKPISLSAYQTQMSRIEADTFSAVLMPAFIATITSVLVETRKRLGTAWAENMVRKAQCGELRILDAGAGGAGILAVRDLLRAEWERMHETYGDSPGLSMAEADGKLGGAGLSPPLGSATVLTASETLRHRASQLLENTTFVPRLPDYTHTETAKQHGKYDIVIAPHTLWPLKEDYLRRLHVQNLWSLCRSDGGVLALLEKGVPRGFELVAGARQMLLDTRLAGGSHVRQSAARDEPEITWADEDETFAEGAVGAGSQTAPRQNGSIIAPCTNHSSCPMYVPQVQVKGRKDICHFEQRYIRPGFLQKILGAKGKNYEDVKFSYLTVMRGQNLYRAEQQLEQGDTATNKAFEGYEHAVHTGDPPQAPSSSSLPRAILPPLKRRGHVILDLCTPSGTLERWTVARSFSRQAFRDARKSSWGDLWALGAKTRVKRSPRSGRPDASEAKASSFPQRNLADVDTSLKVRPTKKEKRKEVRRRRAAELA